MNKAFTITELLVAVGLLAVVLAACGIIFNYSIDAQRTASATSEIMRNLRAITDQLNADFAGLRKDAPLVVRFDRLNGVNADSVVFFSTGDFQTSSDNTIRGNVARIYYGQAANPNLFSDEPNEVRNKILVRKQVIIAPDANASTDEYDANSVADIQRNYKTDNNRYKSKWLERPTMNITGDPNSIRMYLVRGVDNFRIDYCDADDSKKFNADHNINWQRPTGDFGASALKFSFTLYDSKGIIKTGRRFEHIVYIGK